MNASPDTRRAAGPGSPWMVRAAFASALALALLACSQPTDRAEGGSTDTGNTIVAVTGAVLDSAGVSAGRSDLSLRRKDYLAPIPALGKFGAARKIERDLFDTVTDASGGFRLEGLDTGAYRLEYRQGNALGGLYDFTAFPAKRAQDLKARKLGKVAWVGGRVSLRPDALRGFVQVYGMSRLALVNTATGNFELLLPAGDFTLRFVDPEAGAQGVKTRAVTVAAGDSLDLGDLSLRDSTAAYPEWSHARRLWINTTKTGSPMADNVYDFPMLVRLDESLIDFAQAGSKGADLRFTKAGGKIPLAYEFERWDSAQHKAEVWVRMDTVRGDAADQSIFMFWGNGAAKDSSSGAAVFSPAQGYGGVWHLGEGSNDAGFPGYLDATGNGNTGHGFAISDTTVGPGAVGRGQRLDGNGAYIKMPDAPSLDLGTGDFCITIWARPDAIFRSHQLVSKRVTQAGDYEFQLRADAHVESYVGDSVSSEMLPSLGTLGAGQWHLLAMRRSGTTVGYYVDGVLDTAKTLAVAHDLDNASDFFIGHDAQNLAEDWQGGLDEVRVSHRAPPLEWLRLSYLNQAAASKLLSAERP